MTIWPLPKTVYFVELELSPDEVLETLKSRMNLWDGFWFPPKHVRRGDLCSWVTRRGFSVSRYGFLAMFWPVMRGRVLGVGDRTTIRVEITSQHWGVCLPGGLLVGWLGTELVRRRFDALPWIGMAAGCTILAVWASFLLSRRSFVTCLESALDGLDTTIRDAPDKPRHAEVLDKK